MKLINKRNKAFFGVFKAVYDTLYVVDQSHAPYKIAGSSVHTTPANVRVTTCQPAQSTYQSTKLGSGITVLTESAAVPSNVQLAVFADVGSRDESGESSGATLLLKNAYLKTSINTNETVNYGIAQMAGGEFEVDYGRESGFYRVNCLSHDVIDVFSMLVDCALEPRNYVGCAIGRSKNNESHDLDNLTGGNQRFNDNLFATAYGNRALGNSILGNKTNVGNLSAEVIQNFQQQNFTNERIVISATGVENHEEFVDLVRDKMNLTQLGNKQSEREAAKYVGGEVKSLTDSSIAHVALAFEGANYANAWPLLVANEILDNNRRSGWIKRDVLKNVFIDDAQSFSSSYSDSGLFGLKLSGSASHVNDIIKVGANTLNALRTVSEAEVELAKAVLKARLGNHLSCNWRRLEERTKSLYYRGNTGENYAAQIDAVTTADVNNAVSKALSTPLTLVAQGGQVNTIGSWDKVSQLFN